VSGVQANNLGGSTVGKIRTAAAVMAAPGKFPATPASLRRKFEHQIHVSRSPCEVPFMPNLLKLREKLLPDGKITPPVVEKIRQHVQSHGPLDIDDARLLVELMKNADEICCEFDELFFPCLREIILRDGRVGLDEQFVLLQMLYADGRVRDSERRFLTDLYRSVNEVTPEFQRLCETALNCPDEDWELGGH
jgi:hypothetical protein